MFLSVNKNQWLPVRLVALFIAAVPMLFTAYELITSGKDSVVFLEGFPSAIVLLVLVYYGCLTVWGLYWLARQLNVFLKLKNDKTKTELLHLQSQVNPHFFFNMLNNLYGLVATDAKKAQALILKLSDLMRYSIYEGEKQWVSLEEEVEYLENYIALHRMRYHKKIDIDFSFHTEQKGSRVMPLLFIILLENAFKHGVENLREDAFVRVRMEATKNEIRFAIENNFDPEEQTHQNGMGLKNLERRLQLAYPKAHSLSYAKEESVYKTQLTVKPL